MIDDSIQTPVRRFKSIKTSNWGYTKVPMNKLPIIVLDRDGVINQDSPHYIKSEAEFIFLPGSAKAIGRLSKAGFRVGIATNQSGIARGLYDEKTLTAIHEKMRTQIAAVGGVIDEIVYCPHLPVEACGCRKPAPGLLLELARRFECQPEEIIFIGDKLTDIQAALRAKCTPILILSPMTDQAHLIDYPNVPIYTSLEAYVNDLLIQWESA